MSDVTFKKIKNEKISIAKDLCYGKDVIAELERCTTERGLCDVLAKARRNMR